MNNFQKMLRISGRSLSIATNFSSNHRLVDALRDMVKVGTMEVVNSTYTNHDFYKHPFDNSKSTNTYEKCLDVWLQWDSEIITVTTFEGDVAYGYRTNKRNEFELKGNWFDLTVFQKEVKRNFEQHTRELQEKIEYAEFERKRLIIAENLLTNFNPEEVEDE